MSSQMNHYGPIIDNITKSADTISSSSTNIKLPFTQESENLEMMKKLLNPAGNLSESFNPSGKSLAEDLLLKIQSLNKKIELASAEKDLYEKLVVFVRENEALYDTIHEHSSVRITASEGKNIL